MYHVILLLFINIGFISVDKFDQFWSVNRKLMEHTADDGFRHIPFRLYVYPELSSKPYIQFLIKPVENEKKTTVEDLLARTNIKIESKGINVYSISIIRFYNENFVLFLH